MRRKQKNWSRRHELKQMMKINILVNTDHNITYCDKLYRKINVQMVLIPQQ